MDLCSDVRAGRAVGVVPRGILPGSVGNVTDQLGIVGSQQNSQSAAGSEETRPGGDLVDVPKAAVPCEKPPVRGACDAGEVVTMSGRGQVVIRSQRCQGSRWGGARGRRKRIPRLSMLEQIIAPRRPAIGDFGRSPSRTRAGSAAGFSGPAVTGRSRHQAWGCGTDRLCRCA